MKSSFDPLRPRRLLSGGEAGTGQATAPARAGGACPATPVAAARARDGGHAAGTLWARPAWVEFTVGDREPGRAARPVQGSRRAGEGCSDSAGASPAGPGGGDAPAGGRRPAPDAGERARRLLARAREEAARLLAEARAEAARVRQQARQEGYEQGRAEADRELAAERQRLEREWSRRREELEEAYRRLLAATRNDVLELAFAVARRVAGETLAADPERLREQIDEALGRLGSEGARVLLHPEIARRLAHSCPLPAGVEVVGDAALAPGDFVIDSPRGGVDGRIDSQIARLRGAVAEEVGTG